MFANIMKFLHYFEKKERIRFSKFIRDYFCYSNKSDSYKSQCKRIATLIDEFEVYIHKEIYLDSFDNRTSDDYVHFLKSKNFMSSTVKGYVRRASQLLDKARKNGYIVQNMLSDIRIANEDTGSIYLTMQEINKLNNIRLNKESAQVRDIFLIGCLTALRYSDYSKLTEENFNDGNISILTQKTKNRVVIPIHHIVADILKRNDGYSFLHYKRSKPNFNTFIKRICKKAGINDRVVIERTEGFKKVRRVYKKFELVSSHTARRTGATNMRLAGIPVFRIMLITGHLTEQSCELYLRIGKEENSKELKEHDFFKGNV